MTTAFIGMKEFRQNMAKISDEACKSMRRLIILKKDQPMFELRPLSKKEAFEEDLVMRLERAKTGKTYTTAEVRKRLGLGSL